MLHNGTSSEDHTHALDPADAVRRFAQYTSMWHTDDTLPPAGGDNLMDLHRANFDLWHLEDRARDPLSTDSAIAEVKRAIDRVNQRRNDLVERVDGDLLRALATADLPNAASPLHSETPGLILDRLSILALKIFHTEEQIDRTDITSTQRDRNRQRLAVLQQQSGDLGVCLSDLWREICNGTRQFRLYRQMKMYNDPELNPVLYAAAAETATTER